MRFAALFTIFLLLASCNPALGYEITVVREEIGALAQQIEQAFAAELEQLLPAAGVKAVQSHFYHQVVISGEDSPSSLKGRMSATRPDLIVALGDKGLNAAAQLTEVPIIALLVPGVAKKRENRPNIWAIDLLLSPRKQLDVMSRVLPTVKRVGVIYNPASSQELVEQAKRERPDLHFLDLPAENEKQVDQLLDTMAGRIDLLWMLPDLSVCSPRTFPYYQRFSFSRKIPLLSFSEQHVKAGAALAVTFDLAALGKQAAALADRLLRGTSPPPSSVVEPDHLKSVINETILRKMDISVQGGLP